MTKTVQLPSITLGAEIRATSFNEDDNTIDVIFSTGAKVRRYSWSEGPYDEELEVSDKSVRLERLNLGAPFLDTHDSYRVRSMLGSVVPGSAYIKDGKGHAKVALSRREEVKGAVQDIRDGILRNVSVGYRYHKVEKIEGQEGDPALWRVVDWEPLEISAVPVPADPGAQIRSDPRERGVPMHSCEIVEQKRVEPEAPPAPAASAAAPETTQATETETAADDRADDEGDNDMARANENTGTAPAPVTAPAAPDADAIRAAERTRTIEINALGDKFGHADLARKAVADGIGVDEFRASLLEKMASKEPVISGGSPNTVDGPANAAKRAEATANALLHRSDPGRFKLEDDAREFRGMSLVELARENLEAHGVSTRGMSKMAIAERALTMAIVDQDAIRIGAGLHSTSDFPTILANVANKTLRAGYEAAPQTFRAFTRETTVPDFKTVSRGQLGEAPAFEKVNEHGEFKYGTLGEAGESYNIATYGKIVGITRQVIINDDLGAFTRIPRAFGVSAANLESDLVWAQILMNPVMGDGVTLFHATHGNLATAGGVSATTMAAAFSAMRLQKGMDGKTFLNVRPKYLAVPINVLMTASQLFAPLVPATTAATVPEYIKQGIEIISEPRLDGGFTDPASGTVIAGNTFNWFIIADPAVMDTVELAYLEGNRGVYTETRQGFNIDGVEIKVRLDAGAKVIDWRAFLKNPASTL